jgi:hypothetical protein
MRPGCDHDAATRLTYDPIGCEVWLDDLAERVGRHQEICSMHAERLTVPRGWSLSDRRSPEPTMFVTPTAEPAEPSPGPRRRRRRRREDVASDAAAQTLELFETLRQELAAVPPAPDPEPALEPEPEPASAADPEPVAEPEPVAAPEPEQVAEAELEPEPDAAPEPEPTSDELPESLRATSPLLSRAFAATGHQRSVLTQRGPERPSED